MSTLLFLLGLICFFIAAALSMSLLWETKPYLPSRLQDDLTIRFAIGTELWERAVPQKLRRKHLMSLWLGAASFAFLGTALYLEDHLFPAAFVTALSVVSAAYGVSRVKCYRHLRKQV